MIRSIKCVNAVVLALFVTLHLIYPPARAFLDIRDPALHGPGIPEAAWRIGRTLTPCYAAWARERVGQSRAEQLSASDISGTEWPLFGSVFYLWGVENLQTAWDAGDHRGAEPRLACKEAIIAASELVIDPKQAAWVRKHWGDEYLHRENVFYRMLVIAALTSREKLLHDAAHLDVLRDQVETFAKELDASPSGLLNDYPGECYPGDVMAAVLCLRRADAMLGTDHSQFAIRAARGFTGGHATRRELPPYRADAKTGSPKADARGCGNSYMCLLAPELWPALAKQWFQIYDHLFWQERFTAAGFREFAGDVPGKNWFMDVDAGPVIAGYGISASAFGVGAARKNGRFDRAYPLTAEMLATVWELPNGTLAIPHLLSNVSDAPLLGEAAIFWLLTIEPEKGFPLKAAGSLPTFVYIAIFTPLLLGIFLVVDSAYRFRLARREEAPVVAAPGLQFAAWLGLMAGALVSFATHSGWLGLGLLIAALLLPRGKKRPKDDWDLQKKAAAAGQTPGEDGARR